MVHLLQSYPAGPKDFGQPRNCPYIRRAADGAGKNQLVGCGKDLFHSIRALTGPHLCDFPGEKGKPLLCKLLITVFNPYFIIKYHSVMNFHQLSLWSTDAACMLLCVHSTAWIHSDLGGALKCFCFKWAINRFNRWTVEWWSDLFANASCYWIRFPLR